MFLSKLFAQIVSDAGKDSTRLNKTKGAKIMPAQVYEGYFDKGQFYVEGQLIRLPEYRKVFITIIDEPIYENNSIQQRVAALDNFFANAEMAEGGLSDTDWHEFENLRSKNNFARTIDL